MPPASTCRSYRRRRRRRLLGRARARALGVPRCASRHRGAGRGGAEPLPRARSGAAAASGPPGRGAGRCCRRLRPGRGRDLLARARARGGAHHRAVRRAARAVLGAGRRARCHRLPAPVRLHPRRAARPVLPRQHGGPAGGERCRAVTPDLRGRPRPASRPAAPCRARRRLPADLHPALRPCVGCAPRGARLS